jgi:hypothetical protein
MSNQSIYSSPASVDPASAEVLRSQHDAAWDRYRAAEKRLKHDHSPAAQREYKAASDALVKARSEQAGPIYTWGKS